MRWLKYVKILSPNIESSTWTPWISWWDCFKWPKPLIPNTNPEPVQTLDPRFSKPADTAGEDDTEPGLFAEKKVGFTMFHYVHNINIIKHTLSNMVKSEKANFNTSYVQRVHVRRHIWWSKTQGSPVSCPLSPQGIIPERPCDFTHPKWRDAIRGFSRDVHQMQQQNWNTSQHMSTICWLWR